MLGCVIINTNRSELPNLCTAQATRAGTTRADIRAASGPLYLFHAICSVPINVGNSYVFLGEGKSIISSAI